MPKFVFPLEALLRQRVHAERERQRELASFQAEMVRLQQELTTLNDELQGSARDMKANHLTGPLDVAFLAAHRRYSLAMHQKGLGLVQDMARQQKKVDDAQRLLAEAAKERKVMEKLREKQFERWKQEIERKEQADADEAGAQFGYRVMIDGLRESGIGGLEETALASPTNPPISDSPDPSLPRGLS